MKMKRLNIGAIPVAALAAVVLILTAFARPSDTEPAARPKAADRHRLVLKIDGNRNRDLVAFDHQAHQEKTGNDCKTCHHLYRPGNLNSPCFECHSDMKNEVSVFDHEAHQQYLGHNQSCGQCHNLDLPKSPDNAKACVDCHADNMGMPPGAKVGITAPSYPDAMHGMCVSCHQKQNAALADCATCHPGRTGGGEE